MREILRDDKPVRQRLQDSAGRPMRVMITEIRGDWKFQRVPCSLSI